MYNHMQQGGMDGMNEEEMAFLKQQRQRQNKGMHPMPMQQRQMREEQFGQQGHPRNMQGGQDDMMQDMMMLQQSRQRQMHPYDNDGGGMGMNDFNRKSDSQYQQMMNLGYEADAANTDSMRM